MFLFKHLLGRRPEPQHSSSATQTTTLPSYSSSPTEISFPDTSSPTKASFPNKNSLPPLRMVAEPTECKRDQTVEELARMIRELRLVHVRGTPTSGKTILSYLLGKYYKKRAIPAVLIKTWPKDPKGNEVLIEKARKEGYTIDDDDDLMEADIVFIIDEGQMSYSDEEFWLNTIKTQAYRSSGPMFCIFTSYGSPSTGPSDYPAGSPLAFLSPEQRVSITISNLPCSPSISLFFTRSEFDDVVERVTTRPTKPLPLTKNAKGYIWRLTNGHPGAVRSIMDMVEFKNHSRIKHNEEVPLDSIDIINCLDNEKDFERLRSTVVFRSFPKKQKMTFAAKSVLQRALVNGQVERDLDDPGINLCYKEGWLHSEPLDEDADKIVLVFPTALHAKYVQHYFTDDIVPFPVHKLLKPYRQVEEKLVQSVYSYLEN
ncbi:hypothetical protein BDD12DRAFT_834542 [Trichophaea hybrida]|nr:hypothetical protein BDD12DRAFT_834542 [Trichophaea hybrida]